MALFRHEKADIRKHEQMSITVKSPSLTDTLDKIQQTEKEFLV